jgi:integrase/recombinase XerD
MEEAIRRFLAHIEQYRGATQNTLLAYGTDLKQFDRVLSVSSDVDTFPDKITQDSLTHYAGWLEQQGYRPATISRKMAAVRSFLDYLEQEEHFEGGFVPEALQSPPNPRHEPTVLSPEEVQSLLDAPISVGSASALRDSAILTFIYETGFRAAEVVALWTTDIDLIFNAVRRPPGRTETRPLGAASSPIAQYLQQGRPHLIRNPMENRLFLNHRGNGLSRQGLWLVVKRWAAVAGIDRDISPNTLRHTRAKMLLDRGMSRREVQKFLGLSSPNAIRVHRSKVFEE